MEINKSYIAATRTARWKLDIKIADFNYVIFTFDFTLLMFSLFSVFISFEVCPGFINNTYL